MKSNRHDPSNPRYQARVEARKLSMEQKGLVMLTSDLEILHSDDPMFYTWPEQDIEAVFEKGVEIPK